MRFDVNLKSGFQTMTKHFPADIHMFKSIPGLYWLRQSRVEVGHGINVALSLITCAGYDDLGLRPMDSLRPIDSPKIQCQKPGMQISHAPT